MSRKLERLSSYGKIDRLLFGAVHDWLDIGKAVANLADLAGLAGLAGHLMSYAITRTRVEKRS